MATTNTTRAAMPTTNTVRELDDTYLQALNDQLTRVAVGDTIGEYGMRRRMAEIAEANGRLYSEVSIHIKLLFKLNVRNGAYSENQMKRLRALQMQQFLGTGE